MGKRGGRSREDAESAKAFSEVANVVRAFREVGPTGVLPSRLVGDVGCVAVLPTVLEVVGQTLGGGEGARANGAGGVRSKVIPPNYEPHLPSTVIEEVV